MAKEMDHGQTAVLLNYSLWGKENQPLRSWLRHLLPEVLFLVLLPSGIESAWGLVTGRFSKPLRILFLTSSQWMLLPFILRRWALDQGSQNVVSGPALAPSGRLSEMQNLASHPSVREPVTQGQ